LKKEHQDNMHSLYANHVLAVRRRGNTVDEWASGHDVVALEKTGGAGSVVLIQTSHCC
jgi:hypothetical protein